MMIDQTIPMSKEYFWDKNMGSAAEKHITEEDNWII